MTLIDQLNARTAGMTVREVGAFLRLDQFTVYEMVSSGKLPHYRVGPRSGRILIDPGQLRDYLLERNTATVAPARPLARSKR